MVMISVKRPPVNFPLSAAVKRMSTTNKLQIYPCTDNQFPRSKILRRATQFPATADEKKSRKTSKDTVHNNGQRSRAIGGGIDSDVLRKPSTAENSRKRKREISDQNTATVKSGGQRSRVIGGGNNSDVLRKPSTAENSSKRRREISDQSATTVKSGATQGCGNEPRVAVHGANSPQSVLPPDQIPPEKALRAAMLKKRFSDTIFKAAQLQSANNKPDNPLTRQEEKARMEREQRDENMKLDAQIRAAKAALQRKTQMDLKIPNADFKTPYEKQRKAARIELEMIERSVEIDDNGRLYKDLESMDLTCLYYPWSDDIHSGVVLEQLGLYLKDENVNLEIEEVESLEIEEGEIVDLIG